MARFKPQTPFNVPLLLKKPTDTTAYGVTTHGYTAGETIYGSFRSFGGSETVENGLLSVVDTAIVETWFRPDITSACRIAVADTGAEYDIIGTPEDIELRHQFLRFKVERVKGGA